jgi:hypothetical protein
MMIKGAESLFASALSWGLLLLLLAVVCRENGFKYSAREETRLCHAHLPRRLPHRPHHLHKSMKEHGIRASDETRHHIARTLASFAVFVTLLVICKKTTNERITLMLKTTQQWQLAMVQVDQAQ